MTWVGKITLILVTSVSLSFSSATKAKRSVIINDIDWPPYFMISDTSQDLGLAKEVLNICLSKLDYDAKYLRLPIRRTHKYMKSGEIDLTIYSYKKEREAFLYFANEDIFSTEYGFMINAQRNIIINELSDIAPYRFGELAGLTYTPDLMKIIADKKTRKQVVTSFSLETLYSQLLSPNPKVDIISDAKSSLIWKAKSIGVSDKIKVLDFNLAVKRYFVTVSKASKNIASPTKFLADFDACLISMKNNNQYQAIVKKYGL